MSSVIGASDIPAELIQSHWVITFCSIFVVLKKIWMDEK
jgi:hypothetical protein